MMNIYNIFILIFGLVFGSFLNVCISRIPGKESLLPASHCPKCNAAIKPYDNLPIISYLLLAGKCRSCKAKISIQYPIVELLTGIVFLMLYVKYDLSILFFKYAVLSCLLIVITFIDLKTQEIPDELVIFGLITGLIFIVLYDFKASIINGLVGFLLGGILFLLIAIVSKGGMGGGDIKLMAVLGLWFGWKSILLISMLAFIIGAFVSVIVLVLKLKNRKDYIPFGPFIAIASMIIMLYGKELVQWYIKVMS